MTKSEYFSFTRTGLLCVCLLCLKTSQSHVLSSAGMSSATWLKIHGLAAKKLTIMDALSMAAIPHSSTYVPVLDKHVVSKVFDEVELIFYTSLLDVLFISCLHRK